jgi:hypothetical protein
MKDERGERKVLHVRIHLECDHAHGKCGHQVFLGSR